MTAAEDGPRWKFVVVVGIGYLVVWAALDLVAGHFEAAPEISTWYPPAGLDLALLLALGLRWWPLLFLTIPLTIASGSSLSWGTIVVYDLVADVAYLTAAFVLLRVVRIDARLARHRDVLWLVVVGALAAPALVAVEQVSLLAAVGAAAWQDFPANVAGYFAGDATGVGMITPFLLVAIREGWVRGRPGWPRDPSQQRELIGQVVLLAAALWAAFGPPAGGQLDYVYLVYLPLGWIAIRNGFPRTTVAVLLANFAAVVLFSAYGGGEGGLTLQFGLGTLTLTALLLASLVSQSRRDALATRHAALHDPLTGLANRTLLADRLEQAAARASRHADSPWALLYLDLDGFKSVNDSLGHEAGDRLLVEVGRRLRACVRPADTVARLGGDEFALLIEELAHADEAEDVGRRVLSTLQPPYELEGRPFTVTASLGSARGWAVDPAEVMRDADLALGEAKRQGRDRYHVFTPDLRAERVAELQLLGDLRAAINAAALTVHLQPILSLLPESSDGGDGGLAARPAGYEALGRWPHAERGHVPPSSFIPLAEESDLIHRLGSHFLDRALSALCLLRGSNGDARQFVSVNVSVRQLDRPEFADEVLRAIEEAGLEPSSLQLEITESVQLGRGTTARDALGRLAASGVRVALDDFGTGFSSLAYVPELPVHVLKLDRAFVAELPHDRYSAAVVRAVLALASSLDLGVIAEGIETREQLAHLRAAGCPLGQGYLLGRPTPAPAAAGGAEVL